MKNLRTLFALLTVLIASSVLTSCDKEVTIDDPKSEAVQTTNDILQNTYADGTDQPDSDPGRK